MTFDDLTPAAPRPLRAPPSFRRPPDVLDILALRSRRRLWVSAALRVSGAALLSLLRALRREGARRRSIAQIGRLDRRHLRDIGIEDRGAIEALVREGHI